MGKMLKIMLAQDTDTQTGSPRHCGQTALRSKQSERTARRYSAFSGREADRTCSSWTLSCRARMR